MFNIILTHWINVGAHFFGHSILCSQFWRYVTDTGMWQSWGLSKCWTFFQQGMGTRKKINRHQFPGFVNVFQCMVFLYQLILVGRCVVIQDFDSRHPSFGSCLAFGVKTVHYSKHRVLLVLGVDGLCCFTLITESLWNNSLGRWWILMFLFELLHFLWCLWCWKPHCKIYLWPLFIQLGDRGQELCESRGGHPGLPSPSLIVRTVSVNINLNAVGDLGIW